MSTSAISKINNNETPSAAKRLCYFYVVIPPEDQAISNDSSKSVATSQELAAIMKRNPRARFQSGVSEEEAKQRAMEKICFTQECERFTSPSPKPEERRRNRNSLSIIESSLKISTIETPKAHDLLMMGREILTKQNDKVTARIEKNSRILCTDTEFPTILQEGCKYNALHLAAKCNNVDVIRFILNSISSTNFMKKMYPNVSEEIRRSSTKHLVTCYLNTPDKMTQETPLHFACKFNCVESVEVLVSHPWVDTDVKNFEGLKPYQIIGSRDDVKGSKAKQIQEYFKKRFIVPIWRDENVAGDPPKIGTVACISHLGEQTPPTLLYNFPDFSISLLDPCKPNLLPNRTLNSACVKVFSSQDAKWAIKAYAGPIDEAKAIDLRKTLKRSGCLVFMNNSPNASISTINSECVTPTSSPRRNGGMCTPPNGGLWSPLRSPNPHRDSCFPKSPLNMDVSVRVKDAEKGLERVAAEYCRESGIPWREHWPFLGTFCDLTSDPGLDILEVFIQSIEEKRNLQRQLSLENNAEEMSNKSNGFSSLQEIIDKLIELDLDGSGMSSPNSSFVACRNPKCRLESRWCNCDNSLSHELAFDEEKFIKENMWEYGDVHTEPENSNYRPFTAFRKLGTTANTDSFEPSDSSSSHSELVWPSPPDVAEDVYATAPTTPVDNDVYEDCYNKPIFLNGDNPGKLDYQVFQILKDHENDIDKTRHLAIFQWISSMRAHGVVLYRNRRGMTGFESPKKQPWEPSFISTPVKHLTDFDRSF